MIWTFISAARVNMSEAKSELEAVSGRLKPPDWPFPILQLFLGEQTPEGDFIVANNANQQCDAKFYIG